jgi:tRNA A-37 threonylcarbamoyl transferase component Bud32
MNRALAVRGINVPKGLAYFRDKNRNYFLTQYYEDGLTLNRYLSSLTDRREKSRVLRDLAVWVRLIHSLDLWQRDFKSSNVLVYQGKFMMVDFESVQACKSMKLRKKMINLAQLNASLSNTITMKDRLFFFNVYFKDMPLSRDQRRDIYQQIWKITRQKNTSLFDLDCDQLMSSRAFNS